MKEKESGLRDCLLLGFKPGESDSSESAQRKAADEAMRLQWQVRKAFSYDDWARHLSRMREHEWPEIKT